MDRREKERITLLVIATAKAMLELLSAEGDISYYTDSMFASDFEKEKETILKALLKDPVYVAKFSEEYLEKLLQKKMQEIIHRLRQQDTPRIRPQRVAREIASAIFDELDNYTTRQTIYLPVSGIIVELEEERLEIGNITFLKMTQERIDEVIAHMTSSIMALSNTPEYKQGFIKVFTEDLQQIFSDPENEIYAVYHVEAEPIRARDRAVRECYQVFDVLRYALPMLSDIYPMDFSIPLNVFDGTIAETDEFTERDRTIPSEPGRFIAFGLRGEVGTNTTRHIVTLRDSPSFSFETDRKQRFLPLELHSNTIEVLDWAKVFEVSNILKTGEEALTNFERTILRSIHWFGNAQTPMPPEYILLSLMSSIEAFLNPPGGHDGVTPAITEGVAALGGAQEEGYKFMKKRMQELYDKRSALSHGDHTEIYERDISELRAIAFSIINLMIQRRDKYATQRELYERVREMREDMKQNIARSAVSSDPQ